jgi:hypothetical protein
MIPLTVETAPLPEGATLLAPLGMTTPHGAVARLTLTGGTIDSALRDPDLALAALRVTAHGGPVVLRYEVTAPPPAAAYPEQMFTPRQTRFTRAADELANASRSIAAQAGGGAAGIAALVAEAERRFDYAHPETRSNDGHEVVPYLSCGLTPGSCVDINTYLVASLRAAGYEAGYIYGYFFPEEKAGTTHDMHCWVVTRHDGHVQEWDIAHHIKAGLGPTRPALDPRPGWRVALGHSMGHHYAAPDIPQPLKLLSEPVQLTPGGAERLDIVIRMAKPI